MSAFTYDLAKTVDTIGDCTSVTVSNVMLNGAALDAGTSYMVTANSFFCYLI